jgi:ATP-dependent DNA ligase
MIVRGSSVHADGPTLVREPFHRDGWIFEEKIDGWRMLAYKDGARVLLVSRKGTSHDGPSAV